MEMLFQFPFPKPAALKRAFGLFSSYSRWVDKSFELYLALNNNLGPRFPTFRGLREPSQKSSSVVRMNLLSATW